MNRFRKTYRAVTPEEQTLVEGVKDAAELLAQLIDKAPHSRESSLAQTNLEIAVMYATRAITA